MKRILLYLVVISIALAGCAAPPAQAEQAQIPVTGVDRCAPDNITDEIAKISVFQRDFDDVSFLAQSTPQNQTAVVILELQRLRRTALDYDAPPCLLTLKENQINYMAAVITTLMRFMAGGEVQAINQQLAMSRELRIKYEAELARLMGVEYQTPTPWPTMPPSTSTPVPEATPVTLGVGTDQDVNVFQGPGVDYPVLGYFIHGTQAIAYARSENNEWLLVQLVDKPDVQGWVGTRLVKVEGDIAILPVPPPQ